jgi:Icc-related predicted phosphoesterase
MTCFFVSDLHGNVGRYSRLFEVIEAEEPEAVFLGGDLFPRHADVPRFMEEHFFERVREVGARFFAIMGNDDRRDQEGIMIDADSQGLLDYVNMKKVPFGDLFVRGYSFVPPSPFRLKDWEKRDSPGKVPFMTIPPEDGAVSYTHLTLPTTPYV